MVDINAPKSMTPWLRGTSDGAASRDAKHELSVGDVSDLAGISVRTLHHWDSVGLVRPQGRSAAGYRTYSSADVGRIHRVLVFRELGLSLAKIGEILDDPTVDEREQLRRQRRLLDDRIGRLREMTDAVDRLLASHDQGTTLTAEQQAEIFGKDWRQDWAQEAWERWGDSEQWVQFEDRTSELSASERQRLHAAGEDLYRELATAKRSGLTPGSEAADELAEKHRTMISQLFECTVSMQVRLGHLYVDDARFVAFFDEWEPGLASWLCAVIDARARRHGIDPEDAQWE